MNLNEVERDDVERSHTTQYGVLWRAFLDTESVHKKPRISGPDERLWTSQGQCFVQFVTVDSIQMSAHLYRCYLILITTDECR